MEALHISWMDVKRAIAWRPRAVRPNTVGWYPVAPRESHRCTVARAPKQGSDVRHRQGTQGEVVVCESLALSNDLSWILSDGTLNGWTRDDAKCRTSHSKSWDTPHHRTTRRGLPVSASWVTMLAKYTPPLPQRRVMDGQRGHCTGKGPLQWMPSSTPNSPKLRCQPLTTPGFILSL